MPTEKPRFSILVEKEMLHNIDEYWHTHRLKNRNAAINDLLRIALSDHDAIASDESRVLESYRSAPPLARKMIAAALDAAIDDQQPTADELSDSIKEASPNSPPDESELA